MLREPGLFGRTVKSRSLNGIVLTERAYPARYATPAHVHEFPLFCVVLDGSYEEIHAGRTHECTASTILFHAAHEEHLERFGGSGGRSLIVELAPAWYNRVREVAPPGVATSACDGGSLRAAGARLYSEFLSGDDASRLVIEGILLEISGEFLRLRRHSVSRPPHWLEDAREYIRANFTQRITLENVGKAANAHPVHVAQTFRRFHNCTIGDYLRRLRLEYACRELTSGQMPLGEIALGAGFSDPSHFHRTFKREIGMSPSQYRSQSRQG